MFNINKIDTENKSWLRNNLADDKIIDKLTYWSFSCSRFQGFIYDE